MVLHRRAALIAILAASACNPTPRRPGGPASAPGPASVEPAPRATAEPPISEPPVAPSVPVCLSPAPADVFEGPLSSGAVAGLPDVPTVSVSSAALLASGVPATFRVEVTAPTTFKGSAPDASYRGFIPEYPHRLTAESDVATLEDKKVTATAVSPNKLTFDVRFTPTSSTVQPGARVRFVAHLRFGIYKDSEYIQENAKLVWSLPALGTGAARGAKITVTHDFQSRPEDPHRHDWVALVPVALYPADDTCILFDLASIARGSAATFSTRSRDELRPYAACTATGAIELRAPPGEYYLLAGADGWGWWINGTVRRKVTVGTSDLQLHVSDRDRNQDNCGD